MEEAELVAGFQAYTLKSPEKYIKMFEIEFWGVGLVVGAIAGKELEQCQRQANKVTEIMLNNFDKVLERDGKLAELEQCSDQLLDMSSAFSKTTKTLAQKKCWENIRCRIYLGLVVGGSLLIILIERLAVFLPQSNDSSNAPQTQDAGTTSGPGD
ncbi:vesicle-associated membrane protein 5-like [Nomascus leucogenys]|uniref:vesicle-associated membrane protein 5-like n=1 Tax=Nomascus leucogenys TaxID=61853 RepID=UPI00122D6842|nr:vesicle-associated membrane protein 5-like [Nomascus leucogenys]